MDSIDCKIKALLTGQIKDDEEKEFLNVDYTLQQQNYELVSRGIESKVSDEFKPKIGITVTYVVAAVVFNEQNEVLMMQEAKSSCAGSWYLPAGRVNCEETFEDAVKREVFRTTGLEFEPTTLLKVESSHGSWFRFVYTGNITGGILKTVSKADQESLQACYVDDVMKLSLRSQDCLKLIELCREYEQNKAKWHSPQLVIPRVVSNMFLRVLIVIRRLQSNNYCVLLSDSLISHIPLCEIHPTRSVHSTLKRFMNYIFGSDRLPQHKPLGILTVEHNSTTVQPDQFDGLCLSLLVICKDPLERVNPRPGFTWKQLDTCLERLLQEKLCHKFKTIMYSVL